MLEELHKIIQSDTIKLKISSMIDQDISKFEIKNLYSDEFSHGIVKFQSLFNKVYLNRDKPIMITKCSKNKGENTKVFYLKETLS